MAAAEDFVITDTKARDIFRTNNPQGNSTFWIVTRRNFDTVLLCPYDTENNEITGNFIIVSLYDLNRDYTYVRRNPAGGRKTRKTKKSRKSRRRKVKKSRRHYKR